MERASERMHATSFLERAQRGVARRDARQERGGGAKTGEDLLAGVGHALLVCWLVDDRTPVVGTPCGPMAAGSRFLSTLVGCREELPG